MRRLKNADRPLPTDEYRTYQLYSTNEYSGIGMSITANKISMINGHNR